MSGPPDAPREREVLSDRTVYFLLGIDLLLIALCAVASSAHLVGFVSALAASCAGAATGLLFAIPKRRAYVAPAGDRSVAEGQPIIANTSLEDISDWLTKTIVGVGLVKWTGALASLDQAGGRIGAAMFPGNPAAALPAGVSVILASTLLGGICAYLWFYRHLPAMFEASSRDAGGARLAASGLAQARSDVAPDAPTTGNSNADRSASEVPALRAADAVVGNEGADLDQHVLARYALLRSQPRRLDDWCKDMFGGDANALNSFGTRKLTAKVTTAAPGRWRVLLTVTATPKPTGSAVFFLHNTFAQTTPQISFDDAGRATLELSAWGAFTVGVLTDDGTTQMELDLSTLSGVPAAFRDA